MPFCTNCGNSVGDRDIFCGSCGSRQPGAPSSGFAAAGDSAFSSAGAQASAKTADVFSGVNDRTASLLCYIPVIGWIPSIFVLASDRFRSDKGTRFHAFQGLYLSVAWLLVDWVAKPVLRSMDFSYGFFPLVSLLKAALLGAWIFMLVKVSQNESYKLPFVGDLAEKSVAEQR
ncbi:MAG: zinc-ribbon domain-containing protein [Bryobacterales bacterium]|nr:zinc-ribbon domain-containing protein [Bryobacterales bacterium]